MAIAHTEWDLDLCKIPSKEEFNTMEKQQNCECGGITYWDI